MVEEEEENSGGRGERGKEKEGEEGGVSLLRRGESKLTLNIDLEQLSDGVSLLPPCSPPLLPSPLPSTTPLVLPS
jgi:hypothetical protein